MIQAASYPSERRLVALACRVLAIEGLAETTLGHVSLRVNGTHLLVRARRASQRGLLFTTADDIALTDLDGNLHPGEPPISLPAELPIHTALLRSRPGTTTSRSGGPTPPRPSGSRSDPHTSGASLTAYPPPV